MSERATFRGGPKDGESLSAHALPCEVRYVQRTHISDCDWEHRYTLRGTPETGWYYEYLGHVLVGPPNEQYQCPACRHGFTLAEAFRRIPQPTGDE